MECSPKGEWKVMAFVCVEDGDPNVNYLSPEAVKLFVQDTHEAYYKNFPEAFGSVITTTFFDEPTMYRAQGRMWTDDLMISLCFVLDFHRKSFTPHCGMISVRIQLLLVIICLVCVLLFMLKGS